MLTRGRKILLLVTNNQKSNPECQFQQNFKSISTTGVEAQEDNKIIDRPLDNCDRSTDVDASGESVLSSTNNSTDIDFVPSSSYTDLSNTSGEVELDTIDTLLVNNFTEQRINCQVTDVKLKKLHKKKHNKQHINNCEIVERFPIIIDRESLLTKTTQVQEVSSTDLESSQENIVSVDTLEQERVTSEQEHIYIRCSKKNVENSKRIRDKRQCCYICNVLVCNLPRHFTNKHSNDTEVAKILALSKSSKLRRIEFGKLQRMGNFYHNCEVLQFKKGELLLTRNPTPEEKTKYSYTHYGPCPDCLGFMLRKHIRTHIKQNCVEKTSYNVGRKVIAESNSLISGIQCESVNQIFVEQIVSRMMEDEVTAACKGDDLILKFGDMLYQKYGTSQSELIRQYMRQMGRLLLELRKSSPDIIHMSQYLDCIYFDKIIFAVKKLCAVENVSGQRPEFKNAPSLGLKLGYNIKKCANFERGASLRTGNISKSKNLKSFLFLMENEWRIHISSNALNTLQKRKYNTAQLLPLTKDLVSLNLYLESEMKQKKLQLESCPTSTLWSTFASLVLARLILFNKRRSGEAAKMLISQYNSRPLWSEQSTEETKNSMSSFEKNLTEKLILVEVEGKRSRKVPILLTPVLKSGIDLLMSTRAVSGIAPNNLYVFARSQNSESHLRGHDCINRFANRAGLEAPGNINGIKLRKYLATVSQIFNLTENESDWMARHLGHNIRVHREFYRLHETAVELTKVSRILMAVDKGEAAKFSGKTLSEIEIDDFPDLEEQSTDDEADANNILDGTNDTQDLNILHEHQVVHSNEKVKQKSFKMPKTSANFRKPWSTDEREAVIKFFRSLIKKSIVPRKIDCDKCMSKFPVLENRKWRDIKYFVKNYISSLTKKGNL